MKEKPIVAITMGDPAGIGPEVIVKSLASPAVRSVCRSIVIGSASVMADAAEMMPREVELAAADTFEQLHLQSEALPVLNCVSSRVESIEIGRESEVSGEAAAQAITKAVELASAGSVSAVVTGPVSKRALHLAGYTYPGQTEFIATLTGTSEVVMMLVSKRLRVALVTTHCALSDVGAHLSKEAIIGKIKVLDTWLRDYLGVNQPTIGVCAVNPHAGDGGIFGREEPEIIEPAIEAVRGEGINAVGPASADTLFAQSRTKRYDAYVAMYHDQGLIPLKMDAFGKGVNVTLGLPIIRTSPDHGTAFDIAGKGIADPGSMIEAIKLAARLARRKR